MTREILVVNDDSITAEGLVHLVDKLRSYGDVTVVAPKTCNSARSCAITMDAPLHLEHVLEREPEGDMEHVCGGGTHAGPAGVRYQPRL